MNRYELNGSWYEIKDLVEMSGIAAHTLRDRLRRGYTVEEAVKVTPIHDCVREFTDASWWEDWIGMSIDALYEIFWKWCISNGYSVMSKIAFSRQLFSLYPQLKTVPTKRSGGALRIIRLRQ